MGPETSVSAITEGAICGGDTFAVHWSENEDKKRPPEKKGETENPHPSKYAKVTLGDERDEDQEDEGAERDQKSLQDDNY